MKKILLSLLLLCGNVYATGLVDMKFGQSQIADTQWNVSACLYTTTCQIYSKAPGTAYKIPWYNGQLSWAAGDYVSFAKTGDATNPWNAVQYNSNGTVKAVMGTGHIVNMGPDYFFFVGNDNNTGQLFSGSLGMNSTAGVTWTGTLNPTVAQVDAQASSSYSMTPLSAGQTATPPAPPPPTYSATITTAQQNKVNAARARQVYANDIYIDQIGSMNNITTSQSGNYNLADVVVRGDGNNIVLDQIGIKQYAKISTTGDYNNATVYQSNTGINPSGNFTETVIVGSNNAFNLTQTGAGEKLNFTSINGNNNNLVNNQLGSGAKYSDVKMTGNGNVVSLDQKDGGAHAARIDVTNSGGANNITVLQQGNTNQTYSIQQSCMTAGGCSVSITQQ